MCPRAPAEGGADRGVRYFLRHEIYKNSVSSVEEGMGMEGQIMCIEKSTFWMSLAFLGFRNALKSLAAGASPQTLLPQPP